MENLWIFLIILFIVIIIVCLIYAWHDNNNVEKSIQNYRLSCTNVIKVINMDINTYDLHIVQDEQTLQQSTLPNLGEISLCRPNGDYNLIIYKDDSPVLLLDHTSLESSYLILARNHFFLTDNISKGNSAKLAIYNDTENNICVNLSNNKSILYATVEPYSFLEYESDYYHEFTDSRNNFEMEIISISKPVEGEQVEQQVKQLYKKTLSGQNKFIVQVKQDEVNIN